MKKIARFLSLTAIAASVFTACSDIPELPYLFPGDVVEQTKGDSIKTLPYEESFSTTLGDFKNELISGEGQWIIDYSTAKAAGYDNDSKETTAGCYYLVSPIISLEDIEEAHVSYEYILRYNKGDENQQLLISTDYVDSAKTATWSVLNKSHIQGVDWDNFETADINIPAEYMGKQIRLAFAYNTNATSGSTWEVRYFAIEEGKAGSPSDDDKDPNTVKTLPYSEAFATTLGAFANETTSGSGEWIIDYSTAKATGYDNASKETTAGTYYLVSPEISLEGVEEAYIAYEYILRYNKSDENQQIFICTDYTDDAQAATWTLLNNKHTEGADWTTFASSAINIPAEYMGDTIRIAFYYNTNNVSGSTWEVRNFSIQEGKVEGGDTPADDPTGTKTLPYSEAFTSTLGSFVSETTSGSGEWIIDYSTAKATGYDNASKETTAGTYYLVSPEISLEGVTEAHVAYEYILNYNKGNENQQVFISSDYTNDATTATWALINNEHVADLKTAEGKTDWNTFSQADINIPAEYMGKTIRIAFYYNTNNVSGSTWEVRNFAIAEGKASEGGNDDNEEPVEPEGDNLIGNGGFEAWSGSTPINWKSTTTAGNATLAQSTDAHSGSYSVKVSGASSANKRLGHKEITLKAGSYHVQFYTKAASTNGSSARPGYTPVGDNGKVGQYVYGDYVNDLTTTEWTEVNYDFTLNEQTTINLVVMCAKNPGTDILIDDYTLTTTDGGLADGEGDDEDGEEEEPETPDTPSGTYYNNTLVGDEGGFTIHNVNIGALNYVWKNDATYGWKASAYYNYAQNAAESWVVSPAIDLSAAKSPVMTFEQALNYLNSGNRTDFISLHIATDFAGDIAAATWEEVSLDAWPAGSDWNYITSTANLATYAGKSIHIGFKYVSTSSIATTWEFKNLTVKEAE